MKNNQDPLANLKALSDGIENDGFSSTAELILAFRKEKDLLRELPTVFEAALESILERMESTELIEKESDSFSQSDMLIALSIWLDKTKSYLHKQAGFSTSSD